ncbi:MAG: hypothetical protein GWP10_22230 [Nitrospiraceae bacterium]|nr:hypothetical protein [Nitrospiraceae bacterium]
MWEVSFVLGMLSLISAFIILATGLDKEHTPLKILFLILGLVNVLLLEQGVSIILNDAGATNTYDLLQNTVYPISLWGFISLFVIIMLLFIYDLFTWFGKRRAARENERLFGGW